MELHSTAVDYAKSGHEARMPMRLKPKNWPHFMEKQSSKTYHSRTALGKLYDKVELVDFVPVYDEPFDRRILDAYSIDDTMLNAAALIKEEYDVGVRRIMSQHDIKTEFEVWSTFVLHHAKISNDYKFHEEIGRLSTALKDACKEKCYTEAGGREYEKLAPFVAAMYKITSIQISRALEMHKAQLRAKGNTECVPISVGDMPMMSFPWLFPAVLGEIAMGRAGQRFSQPPVTSIPTLPKTWQKPQQQASPENVVAKEEDVLQTRSGLTHRGEILSLFTDNQAELANAEDIIQVRNSDLTPDSLSRSSGSPKPRVQTGSNKGERLNGPDDQAARTFGRENSSSEAYDGNDEQSERSGEEEGEVTLAVGGNSLLSKLQDMQDLQSKDAHT